MTIGLSEIIDMMTKSAGFSKERGEVLTEKLRGSEGVMGEFLYYLKNKSFSCAFKVSGLSIVDIMVWQVDHFKANMDRGEYETRYNPDAMLFLALETMCSLEEGGEKAQAIIDRFYGETGQDS